MVKKLLGLALLVLAAAAQETAPPSPRRIALVIGNSAYKSIPRLPGVKFDTAAMEDALRGAGFTIVPVTDFVFPGFLTFERNFEASLKAGDICLVFYAGYTVQADDDNFLLPVNFDPKSTNEMQSRAFRFKRLQQGLQSRGVALKLFILDTPPQVDIAPTEIADLGLMQPDMQETREMVFISAAFPGHWAPAAPEGAASPFTQAVANAIRARGLTLPQVFDKLRQECDPLIPYVNPNLVTMQNFYFHLPEKIVVPPPPPEWPKTNIPIQNKTDREEYLWIPAGKFKMGCVPTDTRCSSAEKPQHEVTITKGFWMGRNEVQVATYRRYADTMKASGVRMPPPPLDGIGWKAGDRPIVNMRWEEAAAYCKWAGGRLPREAEWEMAARGGKTDVYPMSSEDNSRDKANFSGKSGNDTFEFAAPVRRFDANPFGLYDMAGNVWEFVNDIWASDYYTSAPVTDPEGPTRSSKEHVARGGSYDSDPKEHLRISFRKSFSGSGPNIGFRCVLLDTPETRKLLPEPGK